MSLKDNFVSSEIYNSLPYILNVSNVSSLHSKDLEDILSLFHKHKVPSRIGVKLIHKHFDTVDDEIMVLREIQVPNQGTVWIMGPMKPEEAPPLRSINYLVDDDEQLQSYEYTTAEAPDMSQYADFFKEFCHLVKERGLQRMLGLKIGFNTGMTSWMEFEVADKRGNILIPREIAQSEYGTDSSITTEWHPETGGSNSCNGHTCNGHNCNGHGCNCHNDDSPCQTQQKVLKSADGIYLAGKKLNVGSQLYNIVHSALSVL